MVFLSVPAALDYKEVNSSIIQAGIIANKKANLISNIILFQYTKKQSCDILSNLKAIDLK